MSGMRSALLDLLEKAVKTSKFKKVFEPTPFNGGGRRAFQNNDIRVDHGEPGTGMRVLQIQGQTENPTLKKFQQKKGTHAKVAVVKVDEGAGSGGATNGAEFIDSVAGQVD
ncbi:hypothetical protein BJ138DRAFT_197405 [Hygrophoropsis aurantiaca]|uniref:Uncharacterized protein n=1 Tax=Hygrophoropsis aurantiaca TaxID=72124 RepID=A0ACB7ZQN3_9AGAM|nr:hypothetical protein BJ138DRAFT_197405 [Hygrophoropsis aurantiaca]